MSTSSVSSLPLRRVLAALALAALAGCQREPATQPSSPTTPAAPAPATAPAPLATPAPAEVSAYHLPTDAEIPAGAQGDVVRRGREIVTRTHETLPQNAPAGLHCTSCHLDGGTKAGAGPWLGLVSVFPEYRARSGKEDTLQERINDCFERSMNGKALETASPELQAIVEYMRFISREVPAGETPGRGFPRMQNPPEPDRARGQALYAQRCASCHGADAAGLSPSGQYLYPPLAGPLSFNIGAGMARLDTAAAYIRGNMPLAQGGTLSEQEAYDIADYFIHLDRPDFASKGGDWPKGGKPRDARY